MAWSESKAWLTGELNQEFYQHLLDDATAAPARNAKRKKIVLPNEMPWEMSRQGLLKHPPLFETPPATRPSTAGMPG